MNKNEKGFSVVELLLVLVAVGIICGTGWYVWSRSHKKESITPEPAKQAIATPIEENPAKEEIISKDWKRYKSGKGAFSIKFADGLDGIRDTSVDFFIFRNWKSDTGSAKVEDMSGFGADGFFALIVNYDEPAKIWKSDSRQNLKSESFTTRGGIKGTKTTFTDPYEPPCEGLGCNLGDEHVTYEFTNTKTGKVVQLYYARRIAHPESKKVYLINADDPDRTLLADEMAKTLEFQN